MVKMRVWLKRRKNPAKQDGSRTVSYTLQWVDEQGHDRYQSLGNLPSKEEAQERREELQRKLDERCRQARRSQQAERDRRETELLAAVHAWIKCETTDKEPMTADLTTSRRLACLKKFDALLEGGQHVFLYDLADALFQQAALGIPADDVPTAQVGRKPMPRLPLVKWVGNKQRQAARIVELFPPRINTYYEPFLGGGSVLLRLLSSDITVDHYECSDAFGPLIALWRLIKHEPTLLSAGYEARWRCLRSGGRPYYFEVRDAFNTNHDPSDLFFLLRTCKNGFFRFNRRGEFKGSYRDERFGTMGSHPDKVREVLTYWSDKLRERDVQFRTADYRNVVTSPGEVLYLDPPYQLVRRPIYAGEFDVKQFFLWLSEQRATYFLSLDGFAEEDGRSGIVSPSLYDEYLKIPKERKLSDRLRGVKVEPANDSLYVRLGRRSEVKKVWAPHDYCLNLSGKPGRIVSEKVFDLVWHFDFTGPGFCLLDAGPGMDSHNLRSWMVILKESLSGIGSRRGSGPFAFRSMARFDQQETTKFHLDGAPEQSMLILGYEPSRVSSRLFLADYCRAAFDLGITPQQFMKDFNPMFRRGEDWLARYVTELPPPAEDHARILLVNNSSLPFTEARTNPLGVMHKAIIDAPDEAERRIVNSSMLTVSEMDEISQEQQQEFVTTKKISQKVN